MLLAGKVAIVTGASKGLGRDAAIRLAQEGAKLVLVDMDEVAGQQVASTISSEGGEALFVAADVSRREDTQEYVQRAVDSFGSVDILFNNAGIEGLVKPTVDYDLDQFDRVMNVNVRGVFLGMQYVLPIMAKQGSGSIINNSSIAGIVGQPNLSGYVASKHAVIGLTRTAAIEYSRQGIRVNAICPGPIDTEMVQSAAHKHNPEDPQQFYDMVINMVPANRIGKPGEVSALVIFLASEQAKYINGAVIPIDGAMTAI